METDCDEGLDRASPLYQAIIANPTVQLGLSNPRSLLGESFYVIATLAVS